MEYRKPRHKRGWKPWRPTPPVEVKNEDSARGFAFALAAYMLWGFLPFYMKAVAHIPPTEVIAHRILWSIPIAGGVLLILRRTDDLKVAIRNPRMLGMAAVTALLISVNWGIYVWAIGAGRALDTALGYFINPLFSIFLGAVLLKEKLAPAQKVAITLAAIAVAVLTYDAGGLPWVALGLTFSWGFYAFFRKTLPIGPNQGFLLEVLLLSVPALGLCRLSRRNGPRPLLLDGRDRRHAVTRHRRRDRRAAAILCERRQALASVDHRHHAVPAADDDLPDRGLRLQGALRHRQDDRLPADLAGARHLRLADAEAVSQAVTARIRAS